MDYLRFGTGKKVLIMLPGLGDGLHSSYGLALPTAILYRMYARDYTVYMFSRKTKMPEGCTTEDMALHVKQAMDFLGIEKAHILGVSMGGMIAQHFAADYPDAVKKLILVVTSSHLTPLLEETVRHWVSLAESGDHTAFMDSNMRLIYSEEYYRKNKWMVPLMGKFMKPRSYDRFFVQASACLTHDAFSQLPSVRARTLVIGGEQDLALGADPSREIAARIPGAQLKVYPRWGHGLYEEAPDFNETVQRFFLD